MNIRSRIATGIATAGFAKHVPFAPGTFGSLLGLPIYYVMSLFSLPVVFFALMGFIVFASWIAGEAEKALGDKDPGCIVIDEIAGMAVTFFAVEFSWTVGIAGFVLFRFFDILKPFPIRYLEKRYSGGFGVVIDDVAAGIMSNLVLRIGLLAAAALATSTAG
jgi:phosphatidylglycerophosphatase A